MDSTRARYSARSAPSTWRCSYTSIGPYLSGTPLDDLCADAHRNTKAEGQPHSDYRTSHEDCFTLKKLTATASKQPIRPEKPRKQNERSLDSEPYERRIAPELQTQQGPPLRWERAIDDVLRCFKLASS